MCPARTNNRPYNETPMKGIIMNKLDFTKSVVGFIVGAGTTKIVNGIIVSNTSPEKVTDKVAILASSMVIGNMAADATKKHTSAKIDEIAVWYNKTFKEDSK